MSMILELARDQLAALLTDGAVSMTGITVRVTDGPGMLLDDAQANEDAIAGRVRERRADSKAKLTGEPQFWMRAKFAGKCAAHGCDTRWERGDRILRDAERKACYCPEHGRVAFPNVIDARA